jgi:hypothetical protein
MCARSLGGTQRHPDDSDDDTAAIACAYSIRGGTLEFEQLYFTHVNFARSD